MVFDRHRVGRSRTPRPDHGHSHPGGARFHPNVRPRVLDRQRLEPRPSVGLRGGPVRVRDAGDLRARPPVWSPDQHWHRDLPLRALASVAADPAHIRRRTARRGAVRWETTRVAVLRYARAGIFGAIILGLGRAVGETMAVTMTIGNRNAISISLFDQGQTIASWIANNFLNATDPLELSALIELGLVLMLMSLLINVFARLMLGRVLRRGEGAA